MVGLQIQFDPSTGRAQVTGPLELPFLCLHILDAAKIVVTTHAMQAEQTRKIIPANGHALASLERH